jgi:gliding motility-associated-like protein
VPGIFSFDYSSAVYDINVSNGSVNSFQTFDTVTIGGIGATPIEIRGISASKNAKYNFLTHTHVGLITQNFGLCPSNAPLYKVSNGFTLGYKCENYLPATQNGGGLKAIISSDNFVYVHKGNEIQKRNLSTGALITTVALPGGLASTSFGTTSVRNCGLDVDACGNVYAGSSDRVVKFDANLNILLQTTTGFFVYDVNVNTNGEVVAVGAEQNNSATNRSGKIQSINMSCCAQYDPSCCDATICPVNPVCDTDPAFNLIANTAGGVWSGTGITNSTNGTFSPSASGVGTFWVYYTLSCGMDSIQVTVNLCAALIVCEESNGFLTVTGGVGPYTWQYWAPAQTTNITNQTECQACGYTWTFGTCLNGMFPVTTCNTPAGWVTWATGTTVAPPPNYPIQVLDNATNTGSYASLSAIQPCSACPTLTLNVSNTIHVSCFGGSNGSFSVSTTGGTSPYDYTLLLGATTIATFNNVAGVQNFTGLGAGTYTLNVLDDVNCPGSVTIIINQPTQLMPGNPFAVDASCGMNNGSATISATGGTPGYTYSWGTSPPQSGATASNLPAGTYIVTITDNNGCTTTASATINDLGGPSLSISAVNATCGNSDGSATVSPSGGTVPYGYSWNTTPPQNTQTASNIPAGTYTVTVTDNNGCTSTASITINDIGAPTVTVTGVNANCGNADGSATVATSGGTPTYTYNWNTTPPQTGATATGLQSGTYSVTVTDSNGCVAVGNVTIADTPAPTVSITGIDANCGFSDGSATSTVTGGTAPFTYAWNSNPPQTGQNLQNVPGGMYSVTVTDANGCTATASVVINNVGGPTLDVISTPALCGQATGTATVTVVTGGPGPYTYEWNSVPPQFTQTATGLPPGTYTVEVDDGLCYGFASVTVGDSIIIIQTTFIDIIDAACGNPTGSATANPTNGSAPYTFLWNTTPAQTGQTLTGVIGGNYTVTVTDANGCSGVAIVNIGDSPGPVLSISFTNEMCGQGNGTASVTVVGGSGVYSYVWSNGGSSEMITGLSSGNYSVTVNDGACSGSASVYVGNTLGPTAAFTVHPSVVTLGEGVVTFTDNSLGTISNWWWQFGDGQYGSGSQTTNEYNSSGEYIVTLVVTDINGCTDTAYGNLFVRENVTIYFPNAFSPNGDGFNDFFSPIGTNIDPEGFELFIYNRWGEEMYYTNLWGSTMALYPWNGTKNNAGSREDVKSDVYVFRALIKENEGPQKEYIGVITIIR